MNDGQVGVVAFGCMANDKWLAVDLDGTLAVYSGWNGEDHIGDLILPIAEKIKQRVKDGWKVDIFTARVSGQASEAARAESIIWGWLEDNKIAHFISGITATKHKHFREFWDDRAITVVKNKGVFIEELLHNKIEIERAEVERLQGLLYAKDTQNDTMLDKLQQRSSVQIAQVESETECSLDVQVGGSHYKGMAIQPAEYCEYNNIPALEAAIIKYISRHHNKNGVQDLEKAKNLINMIIDMRYEPTGRNHLAARIKSKHNEEKK